MMSLDIEDTDIIDDYHLEEEKETLQKQIKDKFFKNYFFSSYTIIRDFIQGKIKDIAPYKKLPFFEANRKYEEKITFKDKPPLKKYKNGWRWIDVGMKCNMVGSLMKNCGNAGLMGQDEDRTMIALFDTGNKPHVVVTYSPNEKKIAHDVGVAHSAVKTKYHRYVLDLTKYLGARFDADKTDSKLLKMKYLLRDKAKNIRQIKRVSSWDEYFRFTMANREYVSNAYTAVSKEDLDKAQDAIDQGKMKLRDRSLISSVFNTYDKDRWAYLGIKYIPVNQL